MQHAQDDSEYRDTGYSESDHDSEPAYLTPQTSSPKRQRVVGTRRRYQPHRQVKTESPRRGLPRSIPQQISNISNAQRSIRKSNPTPRTNQLDSESSKVRGSRTKPQSNRWEQPVLMARERADGSWWANLPVVSFAVLSFVLDTVFDITRAIFYLLRQPLKFAIVFYLTILVIAYAGSMLWRGLQTSLRPACANPFMATVLPFCDGKSSSMANGRVSTVNFTKTTEAQEQLDEVMRGAGQGAGLALSMKSTEHAVRDLATRVKVSDLASKDEMGVKLDSFIKLAKTTARDLSRFSAKVARVVDSVIAVDNHALRSLESLRARQQNRHTFLSRLRKVLFPFASRRSTQAEDEDALRKTFLQMTSTMSNNILPLITHAELLLQNLEALAADLFAIDSLVASEEKLGREELDPSQRQQAILSLLWARLSGEHYQDLVAFQKHKDLLSLVTAYRLRALDVVKGTLAALLDMQGDLEEFRDVHATQALVGDEFPLEVHMESIRLGLERLKVGRLEMGSRTLLAAPVEATVVTRI